MKNFFAFFMAVFAVFLLISCVKNKAVTIEKSSSISYNDRADISQAD